MLSETIRYQFNSVWVDVLILVLVDHALGDELKTWSDKELDVLILVLVDHALGDKNVYERSGK